jgi:hypothetical protein
MFETVEVICVLPVLYWSGSVRTRPRLIAAYRCGQLHNVIASSSAEVPLIGQTPSQFHVYFRNLLLDQVAHFAVL